MTGGAILVRYEAGTVISRQVVAVIAGGGAGPLA